ncbi:MAG: permease-like cell division protein FtsX [Clostridiales bacterium]|nr:permease-like cell division protein FtsX [Clostridiales bacterium]
MKQMNIKYFIEQGVKSIFLHGFMSFAAISVMTACLIITASFALIAFNIDRMIAEVESQSEITVYIDDKLPEADARSLIKQISAIQNVQDAEFVSKERALEEFKKQLGGNASLVSGLENDNPLRHSFRIKMKDISLHAQTVEELKKIPQIASVSSRLDISQKLVKIRSVTNALSIMLIALLGAVSVFIISNTVKLATFTRRDEIAIMKMVGATNSFIRAPFIIEGFLLGVTSAVLSFFLQWGLYSYLGKTIIEGIGIISLIPFNQVGSTVFSIILLAGIVIGMGGSLLAIRKFLNV